MIRTKTPKKERDIVQVDIPDHVSLGGSNLNLKLNKNLIEEIIGYLEGGDFIETACALVGISKTTFYGWLKEGNAVLDALAKGVDFNTFDEVDVLYAKFTFDVRKAVATSESELVGFIRTSAGRDWRAAMALLEKRFKGKYGQSVNINKKSEETKNVNVIFEIPDNGRFTGPATKQIGEAVSSEILD